MSRNYNGAIQCPYYKKTQSPERIIICEGARLIFPDLLALKGHCGRYCANECGWRRCAIAIFLNDYYQRKEEDGWET